MVIDKTGTLTKKEFKIQIIVSPTKKFDVKKKHIKKEFFDALKSINHSKTVKDGEQSLDDVFPEIERTEVTKAYDFLNPNDKEEIPSSKEESSSSHSLQPYKLESIQVAPDVTKSPPYL